MNNLKKAISKRSYVQYLGPLNSLEIARELRLSDVFIFSSLNAPCPNSLLEAVSSGLPIVSYDYGSVKELLFFNENLIAETLPSPNQYMKSGRHLSLEPLIDKLRNALESFDKHKIKSLDFCNHYNFNKCGEKYISAIVEQVKKS